MLLTARCSKTFTNFCFPSATLIRLYEFLKNSRGSEDPVIGARPTSKHSGERFDFDLAIGGGG